MVFILFSANIVCQQTGPGRGAGGCPLHVGPSQTEAEVGRHAEGPADWGGGVQVGGGSIWLLAGTYQAGRPTIIPSLAPFPSLALSVLTLSRETGREASRHFSVKQRHRRPLPAGLPPGASSSKPCLGSFPGLPATSLAVQPGSTMNC